MLSRRNKKTQNQNTKIARVISTVIRLEKFVWKAAQRLEVDVFTKLVPSDAIMIFRSGIVSQPEYLDTMHERTISRYELRNFRGFMPNAKP